MVIGAVFTLAGVLIVAKFMPARDPEVHEYRDLEVDDLLAYAMGGVLSVTAYPEREPVRIGLYAPLFLAGAVARERPART